LLKKGSVLISTGDLGCDWL